MKMKLINTIIKGKKEKKREYSGRDDGEEERKRENRVLVIFLFYV
jgi:hypothetical protein